MGIRNSEIIETVGFGKILASLGYQEVPESESNREISRSDVYEILSNDRRRCTLYFLLTNENETVPLRDIVDYVAAWENDAPITQLNSNSRKTVYTALRQSHLPKMDAIGVIDYDHLRGEARLTDAAKDVKMYLEYEPNHDIPWHQYYAGTAAVFAVVVLVQWIGLFEVFRLSWTTLTVFLVACLILLAAFHTLDAWNKKIDLEAVFAIDDGKR